MLALIVPDVVPSLQALGLAHAAHQPLLGLIISLPALMLVAEVAEQWQ